MRCVETFEGKEYWISEERSKVISNALLSVNPPKFVNIDGVMINTNSIAGIFDELDMKEKEYRKQGMYKCEYMRWHHFKSVCHCRENFRKYGMFEEEVAAPKSKQLIDFEAKHGKLELNTDKNGNILSLKNSESESHSIAGDLLSNSAIKTL